MFLDSSTGQAYSAVVEEDGKFAIDGPVRAGSYTVYLAPPPVDPAEGDQPMGVTIDNSVPDKYWNESTTDLKIEVTAGENSPTIVFEKS